MTQSIFAGFANDYQINSYIHKGITLWNGSASIAALHNNVWLFNPMGPALIKAQWSTYSSSTLFLECMLFFKNLFQHLPHSVVAAEHVRANLWSWMDCRLPCINSVKTVFYIYMVWLSIALSPLMYDCPNRKNISITIRIRVISPPLSARRCCTPHTSSYSCCCSNQLFDRDHA